MFCSAGAASARRVCAKGSSLDTRGLLRRRRWEENIDGYEEVPDFSTTVVSLGVLSRSGPFDELELTSIHSGVTVDEVRAATGWDLRVSPELTVTEPPTAHEIDLLRNEIDKVRLYLR